MPKVKVRYTEQRLVLLEQLLKDGRHGRSIQEMSVTLFREYAKQTLGREYQEQ
jgi:hypothetical protein